MNTRFRLGISVLVFIVAAPLPAAAQAISVMGGGIARDCYRAVEYGDVQVTRAIYICDLALDKENLRARDRAATYTNRGILYMRADNNVRAVSDFRKSIAVMPALKQANINLGAALFNLKQYAEAMAALNIGIGTEELEARAIGFYNRALTHERLGNLQGAYDDFRSALEIKPDFPQASAQLARFTVVPASS